ncbi:MAG: hypothetical protein GY845_06130 [Planctomycetes bacterium]|nr:hypothetical protein [Planctomycetota bacterium]
MPRGKVPLWAMKEAIWESMAYNGPRPEVISRDIHRMKRDANSPIFGEDTPDPRTIDDIIQELQELPVSRIATLSPHVRECRNDWEEIREEVERIVNAGVANAPEPTWVAPFAKRLRSTLNVPHYTRFLVKDLDEGKVVVNDQDGALEGFFCWDLINGELNVRLYEYQTDTFLESAPDFERFLDRRPEVRQLIDRYKELAKQFVQKSYELLHSIAGAATEMVSHFLTAHGYDISLTSTNLLDKKGSFVRLASDNTAALFVYDSFVTSAYMDSIRSVAVVQGREIDDRLPTYAIDVEETVLGVLTDGLHKLAYGPLDEVRGIEALHKRLISDYCDDELQLIIDVINLGYQAYEVSAQLRDQL